jgi:tRNA 2-selenouridine synthase
MLSVESFLEKSQSQPVFDVRSPAEYAHAHIPGAINLPIFDNNERAKVGTTYKKVGRDAAVLLGLELVGPKLAGFVKQVKKMTDTPEILVHCWRGGMRSGSMAWLLQTAGLKVNTLEGGYKAYRNQVLAQFEKPYKIQILGGKTGSGKTDVLKELAKINIQVIDLEALANHKGSSFGAIGEAAQPSSEQFENMLYQQLATIDSNRTLWLEDESRNVGSCTIPLRLWQQMETSPIVFIDVPKHHRIKRLVRDYSHCDPQLLYDATHRIQKRLGGQHYQAAIEALNQQDYATVADLTLNYYDKAYLHGIAQHEASQVTAYDVNEQPAAQIAHLLLTHSK